MLSPSSVGKVSTLPFSLESGCLESDIHTSASSVLLYGLCALLNLGEPDGTLLVSARSLVPRDEAVLRESLPDSF